MKSPKTHIHNQRNNLEKKTHTQIIMHIAFVIEYEHINFPIKHQL